MPTVGEVAEVVAARVGRSVDVGVDADVLEATAAAWRYVTLAQGLADADDPADPNIPNDPIVTQGMIGFARAVFLDQVAARGEVVAMGDRTVDTVFTPEDLYRHWRHYFAHLTRWDPVTGRGWGIA